METMLWGNATDLSLLTSLTHEQIQELQSVERGREYTLRDDLEKAWEHVKDSKDERFDIVLDNVSTWICFRGNLFAILIKLVSSIVLCALSRDSNSLRTWY